MTNLKIGDEITAVRKLYKTSVSEKESLVIIHVLLQIAMTAESVIIQLRCY